MMQHFSIKLPPELHAAAKKAAKADHRSLSAWIRLAMIAALKKGGKA